MSAWKQFILALLSDTGLKFYAVLSQPICDLLPASVAQSIFSTVILSLPLIQEGQLSVSGERMCTILVNCLED